MWRKLAILLIGILAGPLLAIYAFVFFEPVQVLPKKGPAPGYQLVDQAGQSFGSETLRGSLTLYAFSHSHCTGLCAEVVDRQREVQERLATTDIGLPVRLVTVSIDTEYDTPATLQTWATGLGARPATWTFLTGDAQSVRRLVSVGFGVFYSRNNNGDWDMDARLALVDGWGLLRAEYGTEAYVPSAERLLSDLKLVADEALAADGPGRMAYDAAQLFGCYP